MGLTTDPTPGLAIQMALPARKSQRFSSALKGTRAPSPAIRRATAIRGSLPNTDPDERYLLWCDQSVRTRCRVAFSETMALPFDQPFP